jgi:hypothetical protein
MKKLPDKSFDREGRGLAEQIFVQKEMMKWNFNDPRLFF